MPLEGEPVVGDGKGSRIGNHPSGFTRVRWWLVCSVGGGGMVQCGCGWNLEDIYGHSSSVFGLFGMCTYHLCAHT